MSSLPLDIGLNIVWTRPELVVEFAQRAEELGFESVWSGEHIGLPKTPDWWHGYPAAQAARAAGQPFSEDDVASSNDRETRARLLGLAVAAAAMATAYVAIGWPAPGVSVGAGVVVYALARRPRGDA